MHSLSTQAVQRFSDWLVFAMIEEHVEENRSVEAIGDLGLRLDCRWSPVWFSYPSRSLS